MSWGQPEPLSGQTNPREERPATQPGRSTLQQATHAIWSSDVAVKHVAEVTSNATRHLADTDALLLALENQLVSS
jgi:hypothetical protein